MANKKITELPLINALSGSQIGGTVLPAVVGGTTNQISIENFSKFVNAYNAHTGSAGNVFSGPQTINNNVTINGRLTVNEVVTQYETASVLFSTGSTKLGDELTDKHEFTGSTNITGSLTYNGVLLINIDANTISRLQQTTQSLQVASASLQSHSASVNAQLLRLQQTTQSLHVATASLQAYSASVNSQLARVYQTTQSLHVATASLNNFTASQDSRNFVISQYTSSTDAHIVGISDFTSSQLAVNLGNAIYTASVDTHIVGISDFTSSQLAVNLGNAIYTASVDSHIVGISTYTASNDSIIARIEQATASIQATTASINSFTSSTNAHIVGISTYTSSNETWKDGVRGELSAIEAWTASLDNTYATDAQLYQLYQATRSLELLSGSMIGITNGLMAFTAALDSTYATDAQLYQLYQATRSIELHSGSMIGITNGLMAYTASNETWKTGVRGEISAIEAWTASLDNTYATDAQLYQLYAETASMKGEIAGIESYTASLKAAAIVSSSTQISNYYKFAETASANTLFYGNVTSNGNIQANKFVFTDGVVANNNNAQNMFATNANILYLYAGTSGFYLNDQGNSTTLLSINNSTGYANFIGGVQIGTPGNDQSLTFGGTNSSIYWGSGGPARMYYSTGDIKISSNGATDVLNVKNIGGVLINGGITGSLMATNGVVSSSQQITNYYTFAQTSSANTFYGNQTLTGNLNINGGNSVRLYDSTNTNYWDTYTYTDNTLRVNYKGAGNDEIIMYTDGNLSLEAAITASNFKIKTAGGGVDFSVDTGGTGTTTWEILNDYEEGTWTGTMTGTVSNPTTPVTATGYYTKIGRQVTISIIFSNVDTTGASGGVRITGVPFATAYTGGVGSVILENFDFTGTKTSVASYMNAGTPTTIFIEASGDETTFGGVAHSPGTGRYLYTTLTYFT